jgi:hypothetical protein
MASAVVECLAYDWDSMGSIPTFAKFCKNLEIRISGTRVRIPQGACWWLETWSKTQRVGGKLEQVSCILKLYKACLCISINIITLVETPRQRTRSGARGIGYGRLGHLQHDVPGWRIGPGAGNCRSWWCHTLEGFPVESKRAGGESRHTEPKKWKLLDLLPKILRCSLRAQHQRYAADFLSTVWNVIFSDWSKSSKLSTWLKSCARAVQMAAHSLHLEAQGNKTDVIAVPWCFAWQARERDYKTRQPICDKHGAFLTNFWRI